MLRNLIQTIRDCSTLSVVASLSVLVLTTAILEKRLVHQPVRIAVAVVIAVALLYFIRMAVRLNGFLTLVALGLLTYGAYWLLTELVF